MIAAPVPFEEFSRKSCYEFRIGIEGEGAAAAARYRSTGDVARLLDIIDRLDEVKRRLEPGIAEDFEFHMAVAQASRNDYFVSVLASLKDSITEGMLLARTAKDDPPAGRELARVAVPRASEPVSLRFRLAAPRLDVAYALQPGEWIVLRRDLDASLLSVDPAGGFIGNTFGPYALKP